MTTVLSALNDGSDPLLVAARTGRPRRRGRCVRSRARAELFTLHYPLSTIHSSIHSPLSTPHSPLSTVTAWPAFRTRFYHDGRGKYRVFNAAEYRFYRSNSAPPAEGDTPFATNATLPYEPSDTYTDGTWYLSASYFNGVIDSGFLPIGPHGETYLRLDLTGGEETDSPPAGPNDWRLELTAGGVVRVVGMYYELGDARAEQYAVAYTTDGSTPPADSPDVTLDMQAGGLALLSHDLPAQASKSGCKPAANPPRRTGSTARTQPY